MPPPRRWAGPRDTTGGSGRHWCVGTARNSPARYLTALAALGTADAVKALKGVLFDEKLAPGSRAMVARALGTVGSDEARAALARLADHPSPLLKKEARRGLSPRARKEYARAPTLARPAPREKGKWPYFALYWGGEHWKRSGGGRSKDAVSGRFVLSGIMGSGAGGVAIINGKILRVGDTVSGGKAVAIAKGRVRLEFNGKPVVLTLK